MTQADGYWPGLVVRRHYDGCRVEKLRQSGQNTDSMPGRRPQVNFLRREDFSRMASNDELHDQLPEAAFVQLMAKHQRHLHSFIKSLVPTYADVDDILQETSLALWEKRSQYDTSRDFFRWACGVAHIQVLRHRRKVATDKLWFNDEVLDLLAGQLLEEAKLFEFRREALDQCVERLPDGDRRVVELRYQDGSTLNDLSQLLGSSARSIQRTMARVRRILHRCISAKLREWQVV